MCFFSSVFFCCRVFRPPRFPEAMKEKKEKEKTRDFRHFPSLRFRHFYFRPKNRINFFLNHPTTPTNEPSKAVCLCIRGRRREGEGRGGEKLFSDVLLIQQQHKIYFCIRNSMHLNLLVLILQYKPPKFVFPRCVLTKI